MGSYFCINSVPLPREGDAISPYAKTAGDVPVKTRPPGPPVLASPGYRTVAITSISILAPFGRPATVSGRVPVAGSRPICPDVKM